MTYANVKGRDPFANGFTALTSLPMPGSVQVDVHVAGDRLYQSFRDSNKLDFLVEMKEEVFKAPRNKRPSPKSGSEMGSSPHKKKRTKEDFMEFCTMVLSYTQYESQRQDELRGQDNISPIDSGGSTAESYASESSAHSHDSFSEHEHYVSRDPNDSGDDSWDLITCYCLKPYAGRPMIECNECSTWIHLSCAKIRKTNIPDTFTCQRCRDAKFTTRKSSRVRMESKRISA